MRCESGVIEINLEGSNRQCCRKDWRPSAFTEARIVSEIDPRQWASWVSWSSLEGGAEYVAFVGH